MEYVTTVNNTGDPTGLDVNVPEEATWLHFLYWEEEAHTKDELLTFVSGNAKKLVKNNLYTYHCNILGPKNITNTDNYEPWPEYDLILGFQPPRISRNKIQYTYCSMQNSLGYHRDYICDKLFDIPNGILSYNQCNTDNGYLYERYIADCEKYPKCNKKWEGKISKFLSWNEHDEDLVVEYNDNPPPPINTWEKCLFNIVTESWFDILDITEKTYSSIIHGRPTLVVGAKGVHKYLFDAYGLNPLPGIDYSFDDQECITDRIDLLVNQISLENIDEKSIMSTAWNNQQTLLKYISQMELPKVLTNNNAIFSKKSNLIKKRIHKVKNLTKKLVCI